MLRIFQIALTVLTVLSWLTRLGYSDISGQVIDVDSKRPIEIAHLELKRFSRCPRGMGYDQGFLPSSKAKTNSDGHFRLLEPSISKDPCYDWREIDRLIVWAEGYYPLTLIRHPYPSPDPSPNFDIDHLGSRPIEIKRIHYLSELKYSERKIGVPSPTIEGKFSKDTGVFVTSDQARFDRVTAAFAREHQRTLILARNRKKLALQAWDAGGKPLPYSLPFLSGWDLIGNNPFLVRQGRLYYSGLTEWQQRWSFDIKVASWSSVNLPFTNAKFAFGSSDNFVVIDQNGRQLAIYGGPRHDDFHLPRKEKLPPPTVVSTAKLFSWENARVVCAAAKKEGVVFVITNGAEQRIFDVHLSIDPLKFQPAMRIVGFDPVALKQEITACAYSSSLTDRLDPSLYLAFKGDGIRRYGIGSGFHNADIRSHLGSKERDFYGKSREVLLRNPQHSINVTDLTADVPEEIFGEPGDTTRIIYTQEVVYAVADDQFVYRFLEDGTPDVRIIQ